MSEKGGCLCGQYSYAFPREAVVSSHHCHCTDCQKMTGAEGHHYHGAHGDLGVHR